MSCTKALPGCCTWSWSWSWLWFSADASFCHRENDTMGVLDQTFSVTEDRFGEHVVIELRPRTQDVMEADQEEYVDLFVSQGGSRSSSTRSWRGLGTCCR